MSDNNPGESLFGSAATGPYEDLPSHAELQSFDNSASFGGLLPVQQPIRNDQKQITIPRIESYLLEHMILKLKHAASLIVFRKDLIPISGTAMKWNGVGIASFMMHSATHLGVVYEKFGGGTRTLNTDEYAELKAAQRDLLNYLFTIEVASVENPVGYRFMFTNLDWLYLLRCYGRLGCVDVASADEIRFQHY